MKLLLGILLCVPFMGFCTGRFVKGVHFNQNCGGHLALASKANSVELAKQEMETAIAYAKAEGLTNGYTSVVYRTPDENVGFWFTNMTTALDTINNVGPTELERSSLLLKLHETLTYGKDSALFVPDGISVFPNNAMWLIFGWFSGLLSCGGIILAFVWLDENS